jgi:hypothetical protein
VDRLRGMTGKGNVSEASVLRIVTAAELKRLSGSRPKRGRGTGSGEVNGRPPHVEFPPVYRGALPPFVGTSCGTWSARYALGQGSPDRVAQAQVRGKAERVKDREEAKATL